MYTNRGVGLLTPIASKTQIMMWGVPEPDVGRLANWELAPLGHTSALTTTMKKLLLAGALLVTAAPGLRAQTTPPPAWTDHTRALPDKLRQVPMGLTLWHTPNPNYPEPNPQQPGGYVWKHSTMVRSEVGELEVVECGSFIWYSEAGWQANMRETPAEFAELFQCPGGRLQPGRTYTFAKNYRYADSAQRLYGGDALWYILAKDKVGKLYKGMGLIETEATVR